MFDNHFSPQNPQNLGRNLWHLQHGLL